MELLFYLLCTSLPAHVAIFVQYWDCPWRSKPAALCLAALNVLAKGWAISWALSTGHSAQLVEFVFSLVGVGIYLLCIRINPFKLLFTYVLLVDYVLLVRGVACFFGARLFASPQGWQASLICLALFCLTFPPILHFFRASAQMLYQTNTPALWRTVWLVPALSSILVLYYTNMYDPSNAGSWSTLLVRLSLLVSIIVSCLLLLQALEILKRQTILEEQTRQNEQILALQRTQYANLRSNMEALRRARHDLRQHQSILLTYLEHGDTDQLRDYLQAHITAHPLEQLERYCDNCSVNTLLNYYAHQFQEQQIPFSFRVLLPEPLPISEPDVCVVLGNLLENALEACPGEAGPFVRAAARVDGDALTLIVDNTASTGPEYQPDGTIRSTKHAGNGIGTQSIRYIAQQYGGTATFQWTQGMFCASVFLRMPSPPASPKATPPVSVSP